MKAFIDFKVDTTHARRQLEKLSRDCRKVVIRYYFVRLFRCLRWKYQSNDALRDIIDILLYWAWLGILVAIIFAISIVQYLKPWL